MNATSERLTIKQLQQRKRRQMGIVIHVCIILSLCCLLIVEIIFLMHTFLSDTGSSTIVPDVTESVSSKKESSQQEVLLEDWNLILVNAENPLPKDYTVTLTQLQNNQAVDSRCYPDLQEMMDDCREDGCKPLICSSYRTTKKQQKLFLEQINKLVSQGCSKEAAYKKASSSVAPPGTSEHQLGLAVDIVDSDFQSLVPSQENTTTQKWLIENSWKYGFILRYPAEKSELTGIIYEPWHYRYVGKEAAKIMYEESLCLEEFLLSL